ncbi:MAG TPA: hypothetical protein VGN63_03660 [Flavisolibacter sp.]|nr:hypothetical protein [Flavisolibacter sp.]
MLFWKHRILSIDIPMQTGPDQLPDASIGFGVDGRLRPINSSQPKK